MCDVLGLQKNYPCYCVLLGESREKITEATFYGLDLQLAVEGFSYVFVISFSL